MAVPRTAKRSPASVRILYDVSCINWRHVGVSNFSSRGLNNPTDPAVTAIEDVEWELFERLELSAQGDGVPEPRPSQIRGAACRPVDPNNPAPTHTDYDAVMDPALRSV